MCCEICGQMNWLAGLVVSWILSVFLPVYVWAFFRFKSLNAHRHFCLCHHVWKKKLHHLCHFQIYFILDMRVESVREEERVPTQPISWHLGGINMSQLYSKLWDMCMCLWKSWLLSCYDKFIPYICLFWIWH